MRGSLRVLCVDDDPAVTELIAPRLRRELPDATVTTVESAAAGLAELDERAVHCVVSDHELPGMTGLAFLQAVRGRGFDVPFVLFTGAGSEALASEAISAGVTDYLHKGGTEQYELLAKRAANAISQWRAERDLERVRRKMAQLHDSASELRTASDPAAVYELGVDAAIEVLEFDTCGFYGVEDGAFVPRKLYNLPSDHERLDVEDGLVGDAYRSGDASLIPDVRDSELASPVREAFRSCITVPVGDHGVFQAVSTEADFFDERDLELAELLVSHVAGALDRIEYERTLSWTNEQLDVVLGTTTAHIYIKDLDGRYTLVNEQFADRLGMERGEIVGRTDREIQEPEIAEEIRANDRRAIEEGEPVETEEAANWDGQRRVYYSVKVPVFDDDGQPKGVCGVSTDITELKARERELKRKTERLDEFASVVSHDLRNPLTVAMGWLDAVEGNRRAVGEIETSLSRMGQIVEDLLGLARGGRRINETEPVRVAAVAERAWSTVDTGDATLRLDSSRVVDADPSRLQQVFENLFRNAVEHGGGDPDVWVEDTGDGFAVADDGPGLPEDTAIMTAGFSTVEEGTGFGLAIVDRIAEAHGWEVTAADCGPGARFEFSVDGQRDQL